MDAHRQASRPQVKHLVVLFLAAFSALVFANCIVKPLGVDTTEPVVVIDESFTEGERGNIIDGIAAWHSAVTQFNFHLDFEQHADIIGDALSGEAGAIYIVRNKGTHDTDCPSGHREIGDDNIAITNSKRGYAIICMDSTYINAHRAPDDEWRRVTMHEMGHAMGMPHRPMPSVMAIPDNNIAEFPSHADIAFMKEYWGLP